MTINTRSISGPVGQVVCLGLAALALAVLGAWLLSGELQKAVVGSAVGFVFVALLGGLAKRAIDDLEKAQERRRERTQFLTNVLNDLKAVYDRVEQSKALIRAHRSGLTYGNEMRDLIKARVTLLNVTRALETAPDGEDFASLQGHVTAMAAYLGKLLREFETEYLGISRKQSEYEAHIRFRLNAILEGKEPVALNESLDPWREVRELPELQTLIRTDPVEPTPVGDKPADASYKVAFLDHLDGASAELRKRLQAGG